MILHFEVVEGYLSLIDFLLEDLWKRIHFCLIHFFGIDIFLLGMRVVHSHFFHFRALEASPFFHHCLFSLIVAFDEFGHHISFGFAHWAFPKYSVVAVGLIVVFPLPFEIRFGSLCFRIADWFVVGSNLHKV